MQYTIRNVLEALHAILRERAKKEGKSLNQVILEAMAHALGVPQEPVRQRDLGELVGTWREDPEIDRAIRDQDQIDVSLWR